MKNLLLILLLSKFSKNALSKNWFYHYGYFEGKKDWKMLRDVILAYVILLILKLIPVLTTIYFIFWCLNKFGVI